MQGNIESNRARKRTTLMQEHRYVNRQSLHAASVS